MIANTLTNQSTLQHAFSKRRALKGARLTTSCFLLLVRDERDFFPKNSGSTDVINTFGEIHVKENSISNCINKVGKAKCSSTVPPANPARFVDDALKSTDFCNST